ncbi:nucleoid-structuring protein H-NS [Reichenbachiella carrageenanivorans]|uniref:Nucleoid-structuring protein H-NS n=1 Tax=Reichenbachiella carrageenanivorans TaxID=2979869 RepID=A0ABY6D3M3_9BACT|nr:nucleoid-structuring protein H-NS [Reichenbachiella carrageenanivorans]UXX78440.1 nucleoid-structuring protein H-NS [Reichenbachiella carrageenanivorans]
MTKQTLNISPLSLVILIAMIISVSSCKSKKNLAQVTAPIEEVEEDEVPVNEVEETPVVEERIPEKIPTKEEKLNKYMRAVSSAPSTAAANASIDEALTMFSSSEAPVLVVIYHDGANPDYDEPTTIGKYLDYLKDTKSKPAEVEEVVYDSNGNIKELVLKK